MENQSRSFVQGLKKLLLTPANVALALVTLQVLQAAEPFYQFFVKLNFLVLAWGGLCFLYDLVTRRTALRTRYTLLFLLYLVLYAAGRFLNRENNLVGNFKIFAYAGLYLFVFYPGGGRTEQERTGELLRYNGAVLILSFLFSIASLGMFFLQIGYVTPEGILQGFQSPVLWGIYRNPNTGGMIAVLSVIMVFLDGTLRRRRRGRLPRVLVVFYVCSLLVQYMYLLLCNSRGSLVSGLAVLFFAGAYRFYFYFRKKFRRAACPALCLALCLAACVTVGAYAGGSLVKHGLSYIPVAVEELKAGGEEAPASGASSEQPETAPQQEAEDSSAEASSKPEETHVTVDREKEDGDVSTGRFLIWEAGLKALEEKPLLGWGADNIGIAKQAAYPELADSKHITTTNMHNGFLQILVANGILGFLPFFIAFILLWKDVAAGLFLRRKGDTAYLLMAVAAGVVVVCSMVENFILLNLSVMSVTLWFYLGQLAAVRAEDQPGPGFLSVLHPFSRHGKKVK